MASTTLLSFRPAGGIRASASSGYRKSENSGRKAQSPNWWTPIFGWSADPDYIESSTEVSERSQSIRSEIDPEASRSRSRFAPGCFTEDKAKQLRMKAMESATFHDVMYHSAIASRLASDVPNRSGR